MLDVNSSSLVEPFCPALLIIHISPIPFANFSIHWGCTRLVTINISTWSTRIEGSWFYSQFFEKCSQKLKCCTPRVYCIDRKLVMCFVIRILERLAGSLTPHEFQTAQQHSLHMNMAKMTRQRTMTAVRNEMKSYFANGNSAKFPIGTYFDMHLPLV